MRTEHEIDVQVNAAITQENKGQTKWPSMTYEQGVRSALDSLDWVRGFNNVAPMDEVV
jgi:hypothetical protein